MRAAPDVLRARVREALERRWFARAVDLCQLALNHARTDQEIAALRSLREEARRGLVSPAAPPRSLPASFALGKEAQGRGEFERALALFRAAVAEAPDSPEAHTHLGMTLIAVGELAEGWREYDWRDRLPWAAARPMSVPRWDGAPMPGKILVVWDEQGAGDAIQFVRFVARAAQVSGARVIFHGQPRLARLFASVPGLARSIPRSRDFPRPDAHASIMSLPAIMRLDQAITPGAFPYLFAEPALIATWRERLAPLPSPRVGLAWRGNPNFYADGERSIPVEAVLPLLRLFADRVRFISLQKGLGDAQLAELPADVVVHRPPGPFDEGEDGFVDTAAIIANLDLVITSDTSIAHLAGALGAPVWIVLGREPDWRWGGTAATTPFYPGARLFRRTRERAWAETLAEVGDALARFLAGKTGVPGRGARTRGRHEPRA